MDAVSSQRARKASGKTIPAVCTKDTSTTQGNITPLPVPKLTSYDTKRPLQRNGRFFGVKTRGQKSSFILTQPAPVLCSVTAQIQPTVLKTSQKVQVIIRQV